MTGDKSGPTRSQELFKRATTASTLTASATATSANGCLLCADAPTCPQCPDGQYCMQTVQKCDMCPKTYCKPSVIASSSKTSIGGITGGVAGGLIMFALLFFLLYKYYFKKIFAFKRVQQKEYHFADDIEINFRHHQNEIDQNLVKPSSRTSIATTILSRASNIIPIAYIPGVTIGSNHKNSRFSSISEADTIDTNFIGDRLSKASIVGTPSMTTTAIRARPKLVNITTPPPNSEQSKNGLNRDPVPSTAVSASHLGGVRSIHVINKNGNNKPYQKSSLQTDMIMEEDEFSELESVAPSNARYSFISVVPESEDYDPFIIEDDDDNTDTNTENNNRSRPGSVLLEVDLDTNRLSNPFEDQEDQVDVEKNKKM